MLCVAVDQNGTVYAVDPQPATYAECMYVIPSGASVSSDWSLLTPEQGSLIAASMLAVWGLAFVMRMLIRALNVDEKGDSTC